MEAGPRMRPLNLILYVLVFSLAMSFSSLIAWGYTFLSVQDIERSLAAGKAPTITVTQGHLGTKVSSHVYSLGERLIPGKGKVKGYAFLRYASKAVTQPKNKSNRTSAAHGKANKEVICYSFLAEGAKRKAAYPWLLNPTNTQGLSLGYIQYSMEQGVQQWNDRVNSPIFGDVVVDNTAVPNLSGMDGKNTMSFGSIEVDGVIAVAYTWGVFDGPIADRVIYETDIIFDQDDYDYCDASMSSECMDLWGIATHEVGHAAGLGHASDPSCYLNTMAPTADFGETLKRTAYTGDIQGIQKLYDSVGGGKPGGPVDSANQISAYGLVGTLSLLLLI